MLPIPPFTLPSDPTKEIILREATVEDAIAFSDVAPAREESAATMFLNRVQDQEKKRDSRDWTAEDRRFALVWYYVHVETDPRHQVEYQCSHCGKSHAFEFDLKQLLNGYKALEGLPVRKAEFDGQEIIVYPLSGWAAEDLELEKLALDELAEDPGTNSAKYRMQEIRLRYRELLWSFSYADIPIGPNRLESNEERLTPLGLSQVRELSEIVAKKREEMAHGLKTEFVDGLAYLMSPPHQCPNREEVSEVQIWTPFRPGQFIPGL